MSQGNVKRLAQFYDAFNAGQLEPLLELVHPDFVYRTRQEFPGGGAYSLNDALERITALRDLFDQLHWEPEEFIVAGERVVVVVKQIARGRSSGVTLDEPVVHLWLLHEGKAKELNVYTERGQALEAVGLAE